MIRRVLLAAGAAGVWLAAPLTAQSPSPFAVTTQPATLVRGTVGLITVRAAAGDLVSSLADVSRLARGPALPLLDTRIL